MMHFGVMCLDLQYVLLYLLCDIFFFKQKTAYEMRISDWSSDVCSSDLRHRGRPILVRRRRRNRVMIGTIRVILTAALVAIGGWGMTAGDAAAETAWDFTFTSIDGEPMPLSAWRGKALLGEIGRAAWRDRVGLYGEVSVGGGSVTKKKTTT